MNPQDVLVPLAARYPVADVTVESPDFEEIIRLIYQRGRASRAAMTREPRT